MNLFKRLFKRKKSDFFIYSVEKTIEDCERLRKIMGEVEYNKRFGENYIQHLKDSIAT